ncbi:helix-turn-helix transcriptional regulator [Cytophagaceae bacterium YF14B1]|uniref:Helix-turn-helix transcriptional regulator n=1 Tax=Xanthocytophaga flava TaxID=3048013 RepID=A0AAE3QXJ8_9BACT|nr:helix-turn-helix transcriptional regulator [Xanthocytophaga flavus]MDJ1485005.1 helix-turn-helix transcriptional regulator [Xanthocytophaga flavus]
MHHSGQPIKQFDLTPLAKAGVFVIHIGNDEPEGGHDIFKPHRDRHYMLIIALGGSLKMMLDFEEVLINQPSMLLVFPEQVHHIVEMKDPQGWAIHFDPSLIQEEFQRVLQTGFAKPLLFTQTDTLQAQVITIASLMHQLQSEVPTTYTGRTMHELLAAILSLLAGKFSQMPVGNKSKEGRPSIIERDFSQLLLRYYKTWKQPSQYAQALSVSVSHLNDTVKDISGYPVSVRIQQTSILEAKRLLYFTNLSVKEIGYEVGYDNPVYFSKLFKKATDLTPLEFRQQFRD